MSAPWTMSASDWENPLFSKALVGPHWFQIKNPVVIWIDVRHVPPTGRKGKFGPGGFWLCQGLLWLSPRENEHSGLSISASLPPRSAKTESDRTTINNKKSQSSHSLASGGSVWPGFLCWLVHSWGRGGGRFSLFFFFSLLIARMSYLWL